MPGSAAAHRLAPRLPDEASNVAAAADCYSVVYFAESAGFVKIGVTGDLAGRLATMRAHSGAAIALLAWMPGSRDQERFLHVIFSDSRHHGEWFRSTERLRSLVRLVQDADPNERTDVVCDFARREIEAYHARREERLSPVAKQVLSDLGRRVFRRLLRAAQ